MYLLSWINYSLNWFHWNPKTNPKIISMISFIFNGYGLFEYILNIYISSVFDNNVFFMLLGAELNNWIWDCKLVLLRSVLHCKYSLACVISFCGGLEGSNSVCGFVYLSFGFYSFVSLVFQIREFRVANRPWWVSIAIIMTWSTTLLTFPFLQCLPPLASAQHFQEMR